MIIVTILHHSLLDTSFNGIRHPISTQDAPVHQFRGIKYASVPARFRQSTLFASYSSVTDATKYGPVCPQANHKSFEEDLLRLHESEIPRQVFKQDEFECLNLNITCPGELKPGSWLPVMLWIHGGGNRGSGSSWMYDGARFVHRSIRLGKPIIIVSINYRLGIFGFAASTLLHEDNKLAGDHGLGNYGLRDQRKALEWVHNFIGDFGGDPTNITLFGQGSGAADIIHHMHSTANENQPLFQRAIVQSAVVEHNVPDIRTADCQLSRIMSQLRVSTLTQLRAVDSETLASAGYHVRTTNDGVFFRDGWKPPSSSIENAHHDGTDIHVKHAGLHSRRNKSNSPHPQSIASTSIPSPQALQPLMIGDCSYDAFLWFLPASLWSPSGVVRRLKAVCGSLRKASVLLRAYDISSYTPPEELVEHVLELINDARIAWPTQEVAEIAREERGGGGVWRYVFDQEGPTRGIPHHATDLIYLFDNLSTPVSHPLAMTNHVASPFDEEDQWAMPIVDEFSYARVRDVIQERWIAFAYGEAPWNENKVFVFGPEGETGERSSCIFDGRRRTQIWREALEPLGIQLVQKVGVELSNGPPFKVT